MPIAKSERRSIDPVFGKLNSDDQGRLAQGLDAENLQYPVDLGTDEYNQFVLFTIFERKNEEVRDQIREVRRLKDSRDEQRASEQQDRAEEITETLRLSPRVPWFVPGAFGFNVGIRGVNAVSGPLGKTIAGAEQGLLNFGQNYGLVGDNASGYERAYDDAKKALDDLIQTDSIAKKEALQTQFYETTSENAFEQFSQLGIKDRRQSRQSDSSQGRTRLAAATEQVKKSIALYIPNKIVNNGSINYSGVDFSAVNQVFQIGSGNLSSVLPSIKRGLANAIDGLGSVVGLNVNANEAIEAITGLVINPRQEQLFQGVSSRSFDFTFSLAPRNPDEAIEVSKIVRTFREFSHPSIDVSSFFLEIPAEFEIRYYKIFNPGDANNEIVTENLFLNKIGRCALTNVNVDYTPNGVNATFPDGSPVRTSVTMTFTELRPLTRQDIQEGF